ncbi:MAG: Ig-like domain-containing protein, partial [Ruminiclostridium sp.]|nr:Ig-like domain-containing protein [Ruminiclostridium sp.]
AKGGQSSADITYEITSVNGVATIDNATGTLTILKAGTVTVKAVKAGDEYYNDSEEISYTLTIERAGQTHFAFADPNPKAITYDPKNNTFSNKASGDQGEDNVTYTITSGKDVASIDSNGTLTILKAGTVKVKATRAADDKYNEVTAEYTLTINKADQTNFAFKKPNPEARTYKPGLTFENKASSDQGTDNVTYTITSDNGVASIDDNGTLTINKAGTVTVQATRAADDKYNEVTAEYTLTINKADQTGFEFKKTQHEITYEPDLTFTYEATGGQSTGNVTYTITSGNDVASIDSATGTLTILKAGTVTVKAVRAGDDCYNASAEISYTLKINKADQTGFEFEKYDNDTYKITYNTGMSFKNAASGGQSTGNITYSLSSDIVSIDENGNITFKDGKVGTVTVTATRAADDKYNEVSTKYTLNISYLGTPEIPYVISGAKLDNSSDWYTDDITITPAEGYKISRSNALSDNEWSDYLTVSTEGNENTETVYLKNDDGITAAIVIGKGQLMIDRTAPAVSVKYDNNSADSDKYFDKNRTATITITEHNFDPAKVEALITVNGIVSDKFNADLKKAESWKSEGDVHTAKITFSDNADYTFSISCTDKAGHVTENSSVTFAEGSVATGEFTVDKTAPTITVSYDNNSVKNDKYFKADRTATITITEHNFDASRVKAVITDKNATDTVSDYAAYLSDPENWTADGDKHTATITFSVDADYTFAISCTDKAGNANKTVNYGKSEAPEKFTVDHAVPENLEISYSESVLDIVLRTISFGFFNPDITVTVKADDTTSGIDYFTYSTDGNKSYTTAQAKDVKYDKDGKAYITFRIAPQYRGKIAFEAFDRAGNSAGMSDDKTVVADNIKPVISVEYDNNKHDSNNTTFYNAKRTATIKITEANFFTEAFNKNYLKITVVRTDDSGKKTRTVLKNADLTTPFEDSNGNVHTAKLDFVEDGDYTFTIDYTDFSGNKAGTYSTSFTIDKTRPTIDVSYDNNSAKNSKYFKADRTATITINEHNFDASRVVAKVTSKNSTGTVGDYAAYLKNPKNWKTNGNTHIATVRFATEADYTFNISYSDKAGNKNKAVNYGKSVAPSEFTIDKTAPTNADIRINNKSVKATKGVAFEKFYRNSVTVKYSVNCDISGLDNITYQKVDDIAGYSADGNWTAYANSGVKVSPSEKFVIYFRAEDKAGNVTIINSTGIVVDSKAPTGETYAPEIDIKPEAANKNGLHNKDVSVDLNVIDPAYSGNNADSNGYYSGLNRITYRISTTDTQAEETGVLFDVNEGITSGSVYDNDSLVSGWTGKINIDAATFNSNNVVVEITATDNAGNTRVTTNEMINVPIAIDVTKPEINISYSNNSVDSQALFKADRVATIAVTERNFKSDNVKIKITNTDGVIPAVSGWTKTGGTGNLDDTIWTATIPYTADGDYEFSIEYTDLADNRSDGAVYAAGTQVPEKFTIDKTLPVINVSYDNNSASNGNYYNAGRTATIVITEHNFDVSRVTVTLTATDDGAAATLPTVSGWTSNGDRHTATVSYSNDSLYTFDIAVKDKAGNDAADFAKQTFYVDKTVPSLTISGVADLSANSGEIIPVISYADTNYDDANVSITLTGAERKTVALDGTYSDQHNGKIFTFNNFPEKKEVDDIYTLTATLTDKAGNTTTKSIRFSANRFGSTYALPKATEELNGSYTQSGKDVVMTETNANQLKNIKVILFKNGETITLKEGDDYRIDVKGGNGQWYEYTYTVYSANFADDGVYRLSFSSEDDAGNKAENTLDTKNKEISFSVDKTKPDIVVTNIENGSTYPVDKLTVTMSASDNILLKTMSVYLDDYDKEYKTWTAEDIAKTIDADGNFTFDIDGNSTGAHKVKVVCTDAAGNEQTVEITDFYVTTNLFVRFYNNKVLFFGTIGGVIAIAAAIVVLVVLKKRKKSADDDE